MKQRKVEQPPPAAGPFSIYRRSADTGRWVLWCTDSDLDVMRTRFDYMVDLMIKAGRQGRKYDSIQLFDKKQVLSSAEVP